MTSWWSRLLFLWAVLVLSPAQAQINCTSVSSPGFSINYVANTTTSVQTYFTVSCTRSGTSDPTSVSYTVKADVGGGRATHASGATVRYGVYTSASCTTEWSGRNSISDSISWTAGSTGTITKQTSYWGCITIAQSPTSSGLYSHSVAMTMQYGDVIVNGSFPVSIYAPALCTVTTPASNLDLPYVAFGPQVSRTTGFAVSCTSGMPYTISTDVKEAVLSGVRYVLSLSATSANGTGAPQSYSVSVTAPAGQAGECPTANCTVTRTHTLTISY